MKRLLGREEAWNKWKNDGCPSFAKKLDEVQAPVEGPVKRIGEGGSSRRKRRRLGDLVAKELAEGRVSLGNPGLTALWNQNPDNLEACRAKDRSAPEFQVFDDLPLNCTRHVYFQFCNV